MQTSAPHSLLPIAIERLDTLRKQYRPVLDAVARLYAHPPKDAPWPKGIVPFSPVADVLNQVLHAQKRDLPDILEYVALVTVLRIYGLWRLTKGAYLFDRDVFAEVTETPIDRLPVELILRFPEPAPLLLFPEPLGQEKFIGAHVFQDWDQRDGGHLELYFLLYRENGTMAGLQLDLDAETLEEAVRKTTERSREVAPWFEIKDEHMAVMRQLLIPLINIVLFLAQDEPDVSTPPPKMESKIKRTGHVREAAKPEIILTGWRWGSAIRRTRAERGTRPSVATTQTGRTVTPHIRRAHWHLYWTGEGSRKDPSKAVPRLRWVPATLVGRAALETPDEAPVTVRPVRRDEE